jgi:hypothetical protein
MPNAKLDFNDFSNHDDTTGADHVAHFEESTHWHPSAAMYRHDWSEKPNGNVDRDLVLNQWRTRLIGLTDDAGRYAARAFHGDYTAIVEANGKRTEKTLTIAPSPTPAATEISVRL